MYHPYLRGKQYELILLRENAQQIADAGIHPVIEPVRADMGALRRALDALVTCGAGCTVIVNPRVGNLSGQTDLILGELFTDAPQAWAQIEIGYYLHADTDLSEMTRLIRAFPRVGFSLVHGGYSDGRALASAIEETNSVRRHIFIDGFAGKLYMRHFSGTDVPKILVRDGFKQQQKNANYPESDHFSDLHIVYGEEGMDGFGDYLTVGASYSESGGPAYAVAIHLTYVDDESDMHTHHFVSDQTDSPVDPAGKFLEALVKLAAQVERGDSQILRTTACDEFMGLYQRQYYPGLGYAKKLSMQHHVELMANVLSGG